MYRSELTATAGSECSPVPPRSSLAVRLLVRVQGYLQNSRTRRQLAQMDGRQLADVGITQAERDSELDKPFWR